MAVVLRTLFIAGFVLLVLFPLWAANGAMDSMTGMHAAHPAWLASQDGTARRIAQRLDHLKAEIGADLCRRGDRPVCLAGLCLPMPRHDCSEN